MYAVGNKTINMEQIEKQDALLLGQLFLHNVIIMTMNSYVNK